jgi:hypothetical protein
MGLAFGAADIDALKVGAADVDKVYLGSALVWEDVWSWGDDFNRADGPIGSDWAVANGSALVISSNAVAGPNAGTNHARTVVAAPSADQFSEVTYTVVAGGSMGISARIQGVAESGYVWRYNGSNCQLFVVTTGSFSSIGSAYTATLSSGMVLRLECEGTAIRGYVDGVLRASATNSGVTAAGNGGIRVEGTTARADNFLMGVL